MSIVEEFDRVASEFLSTLSKHKQSGEVLSELYRRLENAVALPKSKDELSAPGLALSEKDRHRIYIIALSCEQLRDPFVPELRLLAKQLMHKWSLYIENNRLKTPGPEVSYAGFASNQIVSPRKIQEHNQVLLSEFLLRVIFDRSGSLSSVRDYLEKNGVTLGSLLESFNGESAVPGDDDWIHYDKAVALAIKIAMEKEKPAGCTDKEYWEYLKKSARESGFHGYYFFDQSYLLAALCESEDRQGRVLRKLGITSESVIASIKQPTDI